MPIRSLALALALLVAGLGQSATSQTFDCETAYRPDERVICERPQLRRLDRQIASQFRDLMQTPDEHRRRLIRETQEAWESSRHRCRADVACIRMHYRVRLSELAAVDEPVAPPQRFVCTIYQHFGFEGRSLELAAGQDAGLLDERWNDTVSSIRVSRGCQLLIYSRSWYRGQSTRVVEDISQLQGYWNDRISSARCVCRR